MYTRWRLYILAVLLLVVFACILFITFLNKKGFKMSALRGTVFTVGVLFTAETIIVSTLSNFNLGVILPAILGIPMIALSLFFPYMNSGFLSVLKKFMLIGYGLCVLLFLTCGILMVSTNLKAKDKKVDAIIVLGAAVHGDKVTWVLENRLNKTYELMTQFPESICVVSGGQGNGESVTEASAMKKYLMNKGIDEERIYTEEKATNTPENFTYSKKIIDELPDDYSELGFVTTDFHVFRAGRVAQKLGIDATGFPADDVWYLRLNNFMRESVGILVYFLKGQI